MSLKKKYRFLGLGFLLLCWIAYLFAFSKTIEAKKEYKAQKQQAALFSNVAKNIQKIKQEDTYYTKLLKRHQLIVEGSFQNNLLAAINEFSNANDLAVINFNDPHQFKLDNALQETYTLAIRGNYNNILKLIYHLEQERKFGKVVSVQFEKKKQYRTNKNYLECILLLQRIVQQ
ncbi:hypothetical protein [Lutibacter sp.]